MVVEEVAIPDGLDEMSGEFSDVMTCKACSMSQEVRMMLGAGSLSAVIAGVKPESIWISVPDIKEVVQVPDDIAWYSEVTQKTIYEYFSSSIADVRSMLAIEFDDVSKEAIFNRMLYVQIITAMEAYLSDTLMTHVINDKEMLIRLLRHDKELGKERYALSSYMKDPDLPKRRAKKYLTEIIYHNLPKVEYLYKDILSIKFRYNDDHDKATLFGAMQIRHDCVHRNGRKRGKETFHYIRRVEVENLAFIIEQFIVHIENGIEKLDDIPF